MRHDERIGTHTTIGSPAVSAIAATADITPDRPLPLGGYAANRALSSEPPPGHRLEANVLWLRGEPEQLCWVAIDALAVTPPLRAAIVAALTARCGVAEERIVVVASHTHSAPSGWCGAIHPVLPARLDVAEIERVAARIADAMEKQIDGPAGRHAGGYHRRPMTMRTGTGTVVGVGANRNRRDGPCDASVLAIELVDADGKAVAAAFSYACHPTVLGPASAVCSPDWVGGARRVIRRHHDEARLPVLYLPGPAGDVSTRFHRREQSVAEADRLGTVVGTAAVAALAAAVAGPARLGPLARRTLRATTRTDRAEAGAAVEPADGDGDDRIAQSAGEGVQSQRAFEAAVVEPIVGYEVSSVVVGDTTFVHVPFEAVTDLGAAICAAVGNGRLVGYADGYRGYLADRHTHEHGHYEGRASFFDAGETERIVAEIRRVVAAAG